MNKCSTTLFTGIAIMYHNDDIALIHSLRVGMIYRCSASDCIGVSWQQMNIGLRHHVIFKSEIHTHCHISLRLARFRKPYILKVTGGKFWKDHCTQSFNHVWFRNESLTNRSWASYNGSSSPFRRIWKWSPQNQKWYYNPLLLVNF